MSNFFHGKDTILQNNINDKIMASLKSILNWKKKHVMSDTSEKMERCDILQ